MTIPVAKEILFFFIERKKIKRFEIAPKLINPPNFPCLYRDNQLSSRGKLDKIKVKNITEDIGAKSPVKNPIKIFLLFKIPSI